MIEIHIEENVSTPTVHAKQIELLLIDGWEIVSHRVVSVVVESTADMLYSTMLKRDPAAQRVDVSSLQEIVDQHQRTIRMLQKRIDGILADLDSNKDDVYAPAGYVYEDPRFIPMSRVDIVEAALLEDGVEGADGPDDSGLYGYQVVGNE